MKIKYYVALAVVILVVLVVIYSGYSSIINQESASSTVVKTNTKVSNFEAKALDGSVFTFDGDSGIVVFEVFAEWCLPCRKSVPEVLDFSENNESISVVGIAFRDVEFKVKDFQEKYGRFDTTILSNGNIEKILGIANAPQTLFIKDDVIVYRAYGVSSSEELEKILSLIK